MGHHVTPSSMFRGVNYNRTPSPRLRAAMQNKVLSIKAKIEERHARLERLAKDNNLTPAQVSDVLAQYHQDKSRGNAKQFYTIPVAGGGAGMDAPSEAFVPAGVVSNIVTERDLIAQETNEIRKLELVVRNLKDNELAENPTTGELILREAVHTLTDEEMEYLGF